ncbi:MAG: UvrD-helicase domain-containing protein [Brevinemataceae bacterium]
MSLTFDDPSLVFDVNTGVILEASAGSGKTTILTERWIASFLYLLVWENKSLSESLYSLTALTFTRKAAGEMKARIRDRINNIWNSEELFQILENIKDYLGDYPKPLEQIKEELKAYKYDLDDLLSGASITTINAFVLSSLRSHPLELENEIGLTSESSGNDVSFSEKEAQSRVLQMLIQEKFSEYEQNIFQLGVQICGMSQWKKFFQQIRKIVFEYGSQAVNRSLELSSYLEYQQAVLSAVESKNPVEEIWNLISLPRTKLFYALENESAYKGKLINNNDIIYRSLKNVNPDLFPMIFSPDMRGKYKLAPVKDDELNTFRELSLQAYREFVDCLYRVMVPLILPISDLCTLELRKIQSENKEISFGDSELLFLSMLEKPAFLKKIQSRIRFLFVDEYQDTSDVQKNMFDLILSDCSIIPFFVGDPKQSIYRFRKANVYVFNQTALEFQQRNFKHKLLNINYRSSASHVELVNFLFGNIFSEDNSFISYTDQRSVISESGEFTFTLSLQDDDSDQKILTADRLHSAYYDALGYIHELLSKGVDPGKIMVLFRNKSSILEFSLLVKEKAPYLPLSSSVRNILWDSKYIAPLISFLKVLLYPHHDLTLIELLKTLFFRKTDTEINRLLLNASKEKQSLFQVLDVEERLMLEEFIVLRDRIPLEELIGLIIKSTEYEDILFHTADFQEASATLRLFVEEAQQIQKKRQFNLAEFINEIEQKRSLPDDAEFAGEEGETLRLMTIHSSKGLESPYVIYVHKVSSKESKIRFPIYNQEGTAFEIFGKGCIAEKMGEAELLEMTSEEKRLAYVALTRAKKGFMFCALPSIVKKNQKDHFKTQWSSFLNQELINTHDVYRTQKRGMISFVPLSESSQSLVDYQQYQQRYDELLLQDKQINRNALPQFLSVSLLLDMEFESNQFYDKHCIGFFNIIDSMKKSIHKDSGFDAGEIGTLVHYILQFCPNTDIGLADRMLNQQYPEKKLLFDEILSYVQNYWKSEFYQHLVAKSSYLDKERMFAFKMDNGVVVKAAVDLYMLSRDKYIIADYKVSVNELSMRRYQRQLAYYALISEKSGCKVDELVLFSLKHGKTYHLHWDSSETLNAFDYYSSAVIDMLSGKHKSNGSDDQCWKNKDSLF